MPHHVGVPNTGLPLRLTQLSHRGERILEDVSRSCNHQHSLSAREAKSLIEVLELRPDKRFGEDICNLLMCRKVLRVYCFPLHHVSNIMVFYLNVFRFIVKHMILRELHTTLVITMNNGIIHLMIK
jgi:hypothetical protein